MKQTFIEAKNNLKDAFESLKEAVYHERWKLFFAMIIIFMWFTSVVLIIHCFAGDK